MGFEAATKGAQEIVKVESDRDKTAEEVHAVAKRFTDERPGKCFRCGRRNHTAGQCPHIESVCYNCQRQPRKAERVQGKAVRRLTEDSGDEEVQGDEGPPKYTLQQTLSTLNHKPIQVEVSMDAQDITMELDTGDAVSLVSEVTYKHLWPKQSQHYTNMLSWSLGRVLGICVRQ